MQRRAATSNASSPFPANKRSGSEGSGSLLLGGNRLHRGGRGNNVKNKRNTIFHPVAILIGLVLLMMCVSWIFFPDGVVVMEHEAEYVGHQLAQQALRAEHNVEDWIQQKQQQQQQSRDGIPPPPPDREASDAASAAMLAQSSNWVEGEQKLKLKLTELYEKQQQGELLGVPVLTRWLGDDFPAWVTPDMDEAQWRKDVAAKYKEMREQEEQWKVEMEKVIAQRERDLGITTAR